MRKLNGRLRLSTTDTRPLRASEGFKVAGRQAFLIEPKFDRLDRVAGAKGVVLALEGLDQRDPYVAFVAFVAIGGALSSLKNIVQARECLLQVSLSPDRPDRQCAAQVFKAH